LDCGALQSAFHCMLVCCDLIQANRKAAAVHVCNSLATLACSYVYLVCIL